MRQRLLYMVHVAANGVILITTKKGTKGRAKATLKMDGGFSNAAVEFRPTLNGEQRREPNL